MNYSSIFIATLLLLMKPVLAEEQQDLIWHGFISQGLIQSAKSNFINDDGSISTELTELGINGTYQITPRLRAAGQVTYLNDGNRLSDGLRLDYLLLDWSAISTFDWQVNFYFGRIKSHNLLYSSTRDVPLTRPTIVLPQSVYFDAFRDTAVGGDGISIAASYTSEVLGDLDMTFISAPSKLSNKQVKTLLGDFAEGELDHTKDIQLSVYWRPHETSWQFGVALLDAAFKYKQSAFDRAYQPGRFEIERANLNAMYEGEYWEFVTELNWSRLIISDFLAPGFFRDSIGQGFYSQFKYHLNSDTRLLARYERFYSDKNDKNGQLASLATGGRVPPYFGFHNDVTLGVTHDFADNLRFQAEHHWVKGGARLSPTVNPNVKINDSEYWTLWAVQLTYWF